MQVVEIYHGDAPMFSSAIANLSRAADVLRVPCPNSPMALRDVLRSCVAILQRRRRPPRGVACPAPTPSPSDATRSEQETG